MLSSSLYSKLYLKEKWKICNTHLGMFQWDGNNFRRQSIMICLQEGHQLALHSYTQLPFHQLKVKFIPPPILWAEFTLGTFDQQKEVEVTFWN